MGQLAYHDHKSGKTKIPDLTIGLNSYDLTKWKDIALSENDRVRLFDQKLLRVLRDEEYLIPPFIQPGSGKKQRSADVSLTFPFSIWEAKRPGGDSNHQSALTQNALVAKMILEWQDQIGVEADVPCVPLVFYFVSVGSIWQIHGCHFQQNSATTDGRICVRSPF